MNAASQPTPASSTLVAWAVADTTGRPLSSTPRMASALTAALQSGQAEKKQSPTAYPNVNLHRSAFPCLYQDEASKEDDFEIDLSLNKLSLGASPGLSIRGRSSLDGTVPPSHLPDLSCAVQHVLIWSPQHGTLPISVS